MSLLDHYRDILAGYKTAVLDDVKEKLFGENSSLQKYDNPLNDDTTKAYNINVFPKPYISGEDEWITAVNSNSVLPDEAIDNDYQVLKKGIANNTIDNQMILCVNNTEELAEELRKIAQKNSKKGFKTQIDTLMIYSHGDIANPCFYIGKEIFSNTGAFSDLSRLKKLLIGGVTLQNLVLTSCYAALGNDAKQLNGIKFIEKIAKIFSSKYTTIQACRISTGDGRIGTGEPYENRLDTIKLEHHKGYYWVAVDWRGDVTYYKTAKFDKSSGFSFYEE